MQINMQDAKTLFPELIEAALQGETVFIAQAGHPIAKLVPLGSPKHNIRLSLMKGEIVIADDFDA